MGCQCAKSNDPSNLNLESTNAPPRIEVIVEVNKQFKYK